MQTTLFAGYQMFIVSVLRSSSTMIKRTLVLSLLLLCFVFVGLVSACTAHTIVLLVDVVREGIVWIRIESFG